ncbi:MAG TPA: hypothetical protein VMG08_11250 [Allosphingosinicella sp.]|nr:hypothetical protein [Allosphingosinicella sp.]
MSWGPNSKLLRRALVGVLLLSTAGTAAANVLVVRSSNPSYRAGQSLPDNARLTLRPGETVTVLARGGTRTFRGPGSFAANGAPGGPVLAADANGRQARVGAVRDAGVVPRGPTIWHVDVTQSGTFCLTSGADVMLWRPDASAPARFTIAGPGGTRTLNWAANEPTTGWPRGAAIANGATYTFAQPDVAVPVSITFRIISPPPRDVQGVASALIAAGCQGQLDVLVESQPQQTASAGN